MRFREHRVTPLCLDSSSWGVGSCFFPESQVAYSLRLGPRKSDDSGSAPGLGSGQLMSQECLRDATGCLAHAEGRTGQTAAGVEDWSQKVTSSHQTVTSAGCLYCSPDLTQSLPWACCWAALPKVSPRRPLAFRSSTLTETISSSACPLEVSTGYGEARGQRSPAGHLLYHLRPFPLQPGVESPQQAGAEGSP